MRTVALQMFMFVLFLFCFLFGMKITLCGSCEKSHMFRIYGLNVVLSWLHHVMLRYLSVS